MSDNGSIVLEGLIISGGGSGGGGTAATTSFDPTATIDATNVQDAVEEVDSSLSAIAQDIAAISGLGGYINSYDFGTATPTQQALTDYALTQIPNITALEVFNGTRVKNLFDNHIWILTNTPNTVPPVFGWADNGYDTVGIASTTVAGLVKGSATNGGLTIASDGTAAVTGFNTKYDKSGGVLSGDISIEKASAETSLINLKAGTVSSNLSANSSGIFLYRTYNNRLAYDNYSSKWYIYKLGVAKELGLTDASEISYSGTLSSTTVKNAIEEVNAKAKADAVRPISEEFGTLAPASSTRFWAAMDASFTDSQNINRVFENHGLTLTNTKTPPYDTNWVYKNGGTAYGVYKNVQDLSPRTSDFMTGCWFYGFTGEWPGKSLYTIQDVKKAYTFINLYLTLSSSSKTLNLAIGNGDNYPTTYSFAIPDELVVNDGYAPQYILWGRDNGSLVAFFNGTKLTPLGSVDCDCDFSFNKDTNINILNVENIYEVCFGRFEWALKTPPSESFTNPTAAPVFTNDIIAIPYDRMPVNYRQIASKTCTGTAETSLINDTGAKGTNVIPANTLQAGDVIMIDIEGDASGISAATATLQVKYGSTVIATLDKPFTDTYTGIHFDVKATATVRAIGATGKLVLSGLVYLRNRTVQGSGITWPIGGTSEITIDTTAESALDASITWSAENAGNTITASQVIFSSLLR